MITRPITRPITSPIARAVTATYVGWNPRALFANGEHGVIYDPSDLSAFFQDSAGTTPVTAAGQPVGLMLDKRFGLMRGAELIANPSFDSGASNWTVDPAWTVAGGEATKAGTGSENLYQNTAGFTPGKWYAITVDGTGSVRLLMNQRALPTVAETSIAGVRTFYALAPAVDTYPGVTVRSAQSGTVLRSVSVRELPGNHAAQPTASAKPFVRDTPRRIDYDADDSLNIAFPASLGSACTVARSIPGTGAQILTAQTIGTSFTDNVDNCGLIIINRALNPTETANLTRYLNQRAGV